MLFLLIFEKLFMSVSNKITNKRKVVKCTAYFKYKSPIVSADQYVFSLLHTDNTCRNGSNLVCST